MQGPDESTRPSPPLAQRVARGAMWTILTSIGGRAIGVIGTLVITRFLSPHQIGEVSDAVIIALTAHMLSIWGFGQYAVVKGRGPDAAEVTWHATVAYMVVGAAALGPVALFGGRLTPFFDAPAAAVYVAPMALAFYIRRLGAIPERVLSRQLHFRPAGIANLTGELAYTITALSLAATGHGGWSIVIANIVQSTVATALLVRAAGIASWATPTPLRWARFRDMLQFGLPLGIQNFAHGASRYWDNLTISHYFGTTAVGAYNMAYNLADVPAVQVGEQISLVLMPSIATLPPERRPAALERATALLSLIIFPLAVGLGLVADPLIALILPSNEWQLVAPLLVVLASLSVFRPVMWVLSAYLEAESKTGRLMFLELGKLVLLIGGIAALQRFGIRVASAAVGLAFGATAIAGIALVAREAGHGGRRGPSARRLFVGFFQPIAACGVMVAAVLGVRAGLEAAGVAHPAIYLVAMIAAGAAAYPAAALVLCRATARDLLNLVRQLRHRRAA
jgi:PST family polysaccharide transporter